MAIFRTWEAWGEKFGSGTKDFITDTGTVVVKNVCGLYAKYPKRLVLNPYAKGFMSGFCDDVGEPLPDPPSPPFTGGQCEDYYYLIASSRVEYWSAGTFGGAGQFIEYLYPCIDSRETTLQILGKIRSVEFEIVGNCANPDRANPDCSLGRIECQIKVLDSIGYQTAPCILYKNNPFSSTTVVLSGSSYLKYGTIERKLFDFQLVNGNPDVCGDREPEFPVDPPTDPNDFNKTVTINNYNNDGNVINENNYEINIPLDLGNNFDVSLTLGDSSVRVGLDGYGTEDNNEKSPPKVGEELPPEVNEEEEKQEEEKEVSGIKYVLITITKFPSKGKTIIHPNSDNNTYFAGYFSWLISVNEINYRTEEVPIRKEKMIFKAPSDATGYAYYTVNKAVLKATEYTQKVNVN